MSFNPDNLNYTITGFDKANNPIVKFDCDGSSQTLASCPTDSVENAKAFLDDYVNAYIAGLKQVEAEVVANAVDPSVAALVGQKITAQIEE